MAARKERSDSRKVGPSSRKEKAGGGVGWGVGADGEADDIMIRRVLFSALVVVVASVGVWFVVDAVRRADRGGAALSATRKPYTICLRQVDADIAELGVDFARESLSRLRVREDIDVVHTGDGRVAICVGGYDRADDPDALEMVAQYRDFRLNEGKVPFPNARIIARP